MVVLPLPVGPGDENDPIWFTKRRTENRIGKAGHAEHVERQPGILLVENAQHHALACPAGQSRDAHVEHLATQREADAPVLRHPPFAMSSRAMTLMRLTTTGATWAGMRSVLGEHTIHAHAHDQAGLIGLDMDVGTRPGARPRR